MADQNPGDQEVKLKVWKTPWFLANHEKLKAQQRAWGKANRERMNATTKAWRAANPAKVKAAARLYRTGWSQEAFNIAWSLQEGLCGICEKPMLPDGKQAHSVAADHNHVLGHPRGLLHRSCNTRLGYLEKRTPWHDQARVYVARFDPDIQTAQMALARCRL